MKGFKDVVLKDVNVFADTDIFFEVMTVDGREMRIMLDSDELQQLKYVAGKGEHLDGLYEAEVIAYIPVADYGKRPKLGRPVVISQKQYIITDCIEDAGIYRFTLKRARM